jgi:hypothetical protein
MTSVLDRFASELTPAVWKKLRYHHAYEQQRIEAAKSGNTKRLTPPDPKYHLSGTEWRMWRELEKRVPWKFQRATHSETNAQRYARRFQQGMVVEFPQGLAYTSRHYEEPAVIYHYVVTGGEYGTVLYQGPHPYYPVPPRKIRKEDVAADGDNPKRPWQRRSKQQMHEERVIHEAEELRKRLLQERDDAEVEDNGKEGGGGPRNANRRNVAAAPTAVRPPPTPVDKWADANEEEDEYAGNWRTHYDREDIPLDDT